MDIYSQTAVDMRNLCLDRIEEHKESLTTAKDIERVIRLQARIMECKAVLEALSPQSPANTGV